MAYSTYLVSAPTGLALLQQGIAAALKAKAAADGRAIDVSEPLVPISGIRAIVPATVVEALVATRPGAPLDAIVAGMQPDVTEIKAISVTEAADLLAWRDKHELGLERDIEHADLLVANGYDWHLVASRLVDAWGQVGGRDAIAWDTRVVGHIDTGFTEHPALGWQPAATPCIDTLRDHNFYRRELESTEMNWGNHDADSAADPMSGVNRGHGTGTSGVLAGYDRRPEAKQTTEGAFATADGYFGAAPKVRVVPVRVSNCVLINDVTDAVGDALEYLLRIPECRVITLSMGATLPKYLPPATRVQIDRAYDSGVILCCAAGNVVRDVVVPARTSRTIAVAGSTITRDAAGKAVEVPWTGSSRGPYVDIAAPAWPIRRPSVTTSLTYHFTFGYGYGNGTSFATPQVAATAAMWLVKHGATLGTRYPEPWQRVAAFVEILRQTARPWGYPTSGYGKGLLDADAVLRAPLPDGASLVKDARAVDGD